MPKLMEFRLGGSSTGSVWLRPEDIRRIDFPNRSVFGLAFGPEESRLTLADGTVLTVEGNDRDLAEAINGEVSDGE